jgi:hypothetical protein
MIEAVPAVAEAPVPAIETTGNIEVLAEPPAEASAPQAAGFDDVVRAMRMEEVVAPAIPKGRDAWTRIGRTVNAKLDHLSALENRVWDRTRGHLESPPSAGMPDSAIDSALRSLSDLSAPRMPGTIVPGTVASVSAPASLGALASSVPTMVGRLAPYGAAGATNSMLEFSNEMNAFMQQAGREILSQALDTTAFGITAEVVAGAVSELQKSVKQLAQGGGGS